MRLYSAKIKEDPPVAVKLGGFLRGLNKLVSNTQIRPDELSEATNVQIIEDGRVQCPRSGQNYYGSEDGSKVTGISGYYKSDGTRELIRMSGTTLQKYNSGNWDDITGNAYTTDLDAQMITAYDNLYVCNGTNHLTKYNGTSISTYTEISAPTMTSVTRTGGSAGTYTYSYKVTAVTANGETVPSAAGSATADVDALTATVYMTVVWGSVANATGYNVYGRKAGQWYFITYLEGNTSVSYIDKGTLTPQSVFTPPEANTTGGPIGKYIALYKDTLFVFGDPTNPSRLYYSGGGDMISDFSVGNGGGFIDISKNDGTIGTGMVAFKNTILVFKEDSIYQFSFQTTGLPSVTQINPAVGAISSRSIVVVENDVYFASRRGIFTVGNEPGFSFDVLRTNELSSRVRPIFQSIETSRLPNIAAIYATTNNANLVIFSYTPAGGTTNTDALVFDRERLAWCEWTNINANCWAQYIETDGTVRTLYGDDSSGYVKEILTGTDDFGSGIHGYFNTIAADFGGLNVYKNLKDIDLIFRNPTGSLNIEIVVDGIITAKTANLSVIAPAVNWGHYVLTRFMPGDSYGTGAIVSQDDNKLVTIKNNQIEGRSFMLAFDNNSSATFVLLEVDMSAKVRSARFRHSEDILTS